MTSRARIQARRASHEMRVAVRRPGSSRHVLPDFLIIGGQRCGTTSLFEYLCRHPSVCRPVEKELQFFSYRFDRGISWYRCHFPTVKAARGRKVFEATPYYLLHDQAPSRAASVVPEARLVALLRNPTDRAWSHYQHNVLRGTEVLSFEAALQAESERLDRVGDRSSRASASHHKRHSYVARGRYAEQLDRWLAVYPREQLLVIFSEDLYRDPDATYAQVLDFLDLPGHSLAEYRVHTRSSAWDGPPLAAGTRAQLEQSFAPHNARLASLLGTDLPW